MWAGSRAIEKKKRDDVSFTSFAACNVKPMLITQLVNQQNINQ